MNFLHLFQNENKLKPSKVTWTEVISKKVQDYCNKQDAKQKISFIKAVETGHACAVKKYLEVGVNPNRAIIDSKGKKCYPLEIATLKSDACIVKMLLRKGANPNILTNDKDKVPLLALAVMDKNHEIVKVMLEYGASPSLMGMKGYNAFTFARNNPAMIHLLRNTLQNPNTRNLKLYNFNQQNPYRRNADAYPYLRGVETSKPKKQEVYSPMFNRRIVKAEARYVEGQLILIDLENKVPITGDWSNTKKETWEVLGTLDSMEDYLEQNDLEISVADVNGRAFVSIVRLCHSKKFKSGLKAVG